MAAWKGTVLKLLLLILWSSETSGELNPDTSPSISGQCHCATSAQCSGYPDGTCDACEEFWSGPTCQIGNIARSDRHSTRLSEGSSDPDMVVDGDTRNLVHRCTSISDEAGIYASWSIILNQTHDIYRMKIYHFTGIADSFASFEVKVGGERCSNWSGTGHPPHELDVTCDQPMSGDLVSVSIPTDPVYINTLALCEVEIYECGDFWYGDNCDKRCNCADISEICDKRTGACASGARETTQATSPVTSPVTSPATSPVPYPETGETSSSQPQSHSTSTVGTKHPSNYHHHDHDHHGSLSVGEIAGLIAGSIFLVTIAIIAIILVVKMKCVKRPKVMNAFYPVSQTPVVLLNGTYNSGTGPGQTEVRQEVEAWPPRKTTLPPIRQDTGDVS